jgi:hypothetical protein
MGWLMTIGDDVSFIVCGPVLDRIAQFLDNWLRKWPQLRIAIDGDGEELFRPWTLVRESSTLPRAKGVLLVSRDETMEYSWDESGFVLDNQYEGPFIISYEQAAWTRLNVQALADPYSRSGFAFDPHETKLVGTAFMLVSITVPKLKSDFSTGLVETFAEFLEGAAGRSD